MSMNLPLILTIVVIFCGVIYLLDYFYWAPRRQAMGRTDLPLWIDYPRGLFGPLLLVWVIRGFIGQLYLVPTGSLEPTVIPTELLAVKQYAYGLRLPVSHRKIWPTGEPKKGEIVVFRWPLDPENQHFVKRVVGTPGDHLRYHNKVLWVNGKEAKQTVIGTALDYEMQPAAKVEVREEILNGVKHKIFLHPNTFSRDNFDVVVPAGKYFMMGDNRDNSGDSRSWGFVSDNDLEGQAFMVALSWNKQKHRIRWQRSGTWL